MRRNTLLVLLLLVLVAWSRGVILPECGKTPAPLKRILPTESPNATTWPWMVALLKDDGIHYCGGVLISKKHVLTAAHCVAPFKVNRITVRVGEYDLEKDRETRHTDHRIVAVYIHEQFDNSTYENDIAILKLQRNSIANSYTWPICLPPESETFERKMVVVTGWGTLYYGGPPSDILMQVQVPVWVQKLCSEKFSQPILETHLCAGAYEGGKDSCQGDSGGPLMYYVDGHWMTVGIVSWGIRCGQPQSPGIYTRVNKYLDWIKEKVSL